MIDIFRFSPKGKWCLTIDGVQYSPAHETKVDAQRAAVILINSKIDQYKKARKILTDEILLAT